MQSRVFVNAAASPAPVYTSGTYSTSQPVVQRAGSSTSWMPTSPSVTTRPATYATVTSARSSQPSVVVGQQQPPAATGSRPVLHRVASPVSPVQAGAVLPTQVGTRVQTISRSPPPSQVVVTSQRPMALPTAAAGRVMSGGYSYTAAPPVKVVQATSLRAQPTVLASPTSVQALSPSMAKSPTGAELLKALVSPTACQGGNGHSLQAGPTASDAAAANGGGTSLWWACEKVREQVVGDRQHAVVVCVLGGTAFRQSETEEIVRSVAAEFGATEDTLLFVTGGMKGVQECFAKNCGDGSKVYNLLPEGEASGFGAGLDINAGRDLEERKKIFGQLGDIYLTFEGGPGVAQEAGDAFARGAVVLPMIRTGGASAGSFDFPKAALDKPEAVSDDCWAALADEGCPAATSAAALVMIVQDLAAQIVDPVPKDKRQRFPSTLGEDETLGPGLPEHWSLDEYQRQVHAMLNTYLLSHDLEEAIRVYSEFAQACAGFLDEFVVCSVRLALQQNAEQRTKISGLLTELFRRQVLEGPAFIRAFAKLGCKWEDLVIDDGASAPASILGMFLDALEAGCFNQAFLLRMPEGLLVAAMDNLPDDRARTVQRTVEQLQNFKTQLADSNLLLPRTTPTASAARLTHAEKVGRTLKNINMASCHHEYVKRLLCASFEWPAVERRNCVWLLQRLSADKVVTHEDFQWGLIRLLGQLEDLTLDCPGCSMFVVEHVQGLLDAGLLSTAFIERCRTLRIGGAAGLGVLCAAAPVN
eukprot:TRINITY_DN13585_c1_g1_i5.p1 TRINITY_DN13585_c1_g1~~TRINITY_DN13585_c1_g1_i5.p1  ORF type:complete len:797 (-),score=172.67 TRINITY_DN13585_c1_g1_i5:532-2802(-)